MVFNMKNKILLTSFALIFSMNIYANNKIDKNKFGVTAKIGTLGAGLDLTYKINPKLNTRLNLNKASADYDEVDDGVAYKGDLDLFTVGALLDFHPLQNGFRLTGGLFKNNNKISATATNPTDAEIGDITYDITDGALNSSVSFKSVAPYLGLGWGNAVKGPGKWHFSLDAGVLFQGQPKGKLTGTGNASIVGSNEVFAIENNEDFQAELTREENNLNAELEDFKAYPVISLGVSYKF